MGNAGNWPNFIFHGMSPNILDKVLKHSGEFPKKFWGMSSNVLKNVIKNSGERPQPLRGMSPNSMGNTAVLKQILIQKICHLIGEIYENRWVFFHKNLTSMSKINTYYFG